MLNRILPRDIFHFLSSLNCLHWDDISHWVDNGKVTEMWNVYDSMFQVLTIIKHFVTMSFTTLTKFVGNSVSGLWEGKSCEDSSWKLDTGPASTNKGCCPLKKRFRSAGCRIGPTKVLRPPFFLLFITRQASYYVFVQARDYERSKEQTKERGPKGASIFPQNPTRIEDVPFR